MWNRRYCGIDVIVESTIITSSPTEIDNKNVPTSLGTWLYAIAMALDAHGHNSRVIVDGIGVDFDSLTNPCTRVPMDKVNLLWEKAVSVTGDEGFGLEVIGFVAPTTFHALTYAHQASSTLRETLQRTVRFADVISTAARLELHESTERTSVMFYLDQGELKPSFQAIDAFCGLAMVSLKGLLRTEQNIVQKLRLRRPEPKNPRRFQQIFCCPIEFSADIDELVFENGCLDIAIPTANPELARINEQILAQYHAKLNKEDVVTLVLRKISEHLSTGEPSQEKIAAELGMSSRSLHRKLKEKDVTYKALLDDTRKNLALQFIKQSELSITDIAYQLGFFDSSSFSKSFKRWFDQTPSQWRKQQIR